MACDGQDVAGGLDRLLLRLTSEIAAEGHGLAVLEAPKLGQRALCDGLEAAGQLVVRRPSALHGPLVDGQCLAREPARHMRLYGIEPHIALALLLTVVEGKGVQEAPDHLTREAGERELEGRMLVHRVVAAKEREGANALALFFGDFLCVDDAGRVAGAGGGDRVIVGAVEPVPQSNFQSTVQSARASRHVCSAP